ncbi:MAG: RNA polymerase sigma factor [Alphaproteobacteria bacterium]|nr:sigma-70 family RNA polymerase sigma factor [Alphaproteobacteria bacterium]
MSDVKWLISREIPHLRRYARALARDRDEADDLVQDCLERAIRKHHQWRRRGSIRSWLFRTLYRTFINGQPRRTRERAQLPVDGPYEGIHERLREPPRQEDHLAWQDMAAALGRLPDQQRAALLLIALEGMSYDEAADILAVPVGTVRSRLSRAREALRTANIRPKSSVELRRVK